MRINEIFYSLQGEGFHTGTPAVFLRMSGCNLKCEFCDTDHFSGIEMRHDEIVRRVMRYPSQHIVITGGEPSLQLDELLVDMLHEAGFYIQVETNGSSALPEDVDWVTCSPKGDTPVALKRIDELKVVFLGQDVEEIANRHAAMHYFLQPCSSPVYDGGNNIQATVKYILDHPHWRLSLQTHKLIGIE